MPRVVPLSVASDSPEPVVAVVPVVVDDEVTHHLEHGGILLLNQVIRIGGLELLPVTGNKDGMDVTPVSCYENILSVILNSNPVAVRAVIAGA